ncbi:hypothetical protein BDV95DRAFT_559184 [Massariosphaeria phaeospora]|uniref:Uncharacterized protein n=1 Tax=Massariosphaeria phaeospora TaxID=100035 RepID=A0A7C8IEK2_9PLEO|nr:hypothetical protein BDV95DRAFT_559184 [Massariosphaeria phaeospora]
MMCHQPSKPPNNPQRTPLLHLSPGPIHQQKESLFRHRESNPGLAGTVEYTLDESGKS